MAVEASLHAIRGRARPHEAHFAQFSHFELGPGTPAPVLTAAKPGWSLYCLDPDRRQALFLELAADIDLSAAPFAYSAQFGAARRALVAPIETLDRIAAATELPPRLVFVLSLGRCRSTLVGRLIGAMPGAWSLSEPDSLTNLARDRARYDPGAFDDLAAAAIRLAYRPPAGRSHALFAVKPRSQALFIVDALRRAFPAAAFVFLYRDAAGWVGSMSRTLRRLGFVVDPRDRAMRAHLWNMFACGAPAGYGSDVLDLDADVVHLEEFLALAWAAQIERYLRDLDAGAPWRAFHHDDLGGDRIEPLERLATACGLDARDLPAAMSAFALVSHAGTALARDAASSAEDPELAARVRAVLARHPRIPSGDVRLPDAIGGASVA